MGPPWETTLQDKEAEQSWQLFNDIFLREQVLLIPTCKKAGWECRRPIWLKCKKKMHRQWKQGHASWEEYRVSTHVYRHEIRKAKAHLVLNLARDVKKSKKGFPSAGFLIRKGRLKKMYSPQ